MLEKPLTVDPRQTIRWAYTLLLGREPESEQAVDSHIHAEGGGAPQAVRRRMIQSAEFLGSMQALGLALKPSTQSVGPLEGMLGEIPTGAMGFFTDRFGVKTRVDYLPAPYAAFSGQIGSADGAFDMPVHEPEELNALLRSVHEAKSQFAAMELGAGWGPWIVLGGSLARRRNLPVTLAGVEGSSEHVAFMRSHMIDNSFDPAAHQVIHAIVGREDGVAFFPRLPDPSGDWGAEASFTANSTTEAAFDEVPCFSLATLLRRMPILDFLHCDVQGAEADVFEAAIDHLGNRVRRTCIGTHSRAVEARLLGLLSGHGWILEFEEPCKFNQQGNELILVADGVQVWRNPRLY